MYRIEELAGQLGLHHFPAGEALPQQLFRQSEAAVGVPAPQHHRHALHAVSPGTGGNAPALRFAVTRLETDAGFVGAGKGVFVDQFRGFSPQEIPPCPEIGLQRCLFCQSTAEPSQICRGGVAGVGVPLGAGEPRVPHAQIKGTGVHVHDELLRVAGGSCGKHNGGIVGVSHDQPFQQIPHSHFLAGGEPDHSPLGAGHRVCGSEHRVRCPRPLLQLLRRQQCRHQLRHRPAGQPVTAVGFQQHRASFFLQQGIGSRRDLRLLRRRNRRRTSRQQPPEQQHSAAQQRRITFHKHTLPNSFCILYKICRIGCGYAVFCSGGMAGVFSVVN